MKEIMVKLSEGRSYNVVVGACILSELPTYIASLSLGAKVALVTHPDLYQWYGHSLEVALKRAGFGVTVVKVPSGEGSKAFNCVQSVLDQLLEAKFERQDTVLALGGGVVGDLSGFVAAIYLRGIHFIQVPTTLLAQVDAAIGGKTGINHAKGKNLIGAFYQPKVTYCDVDVLKTLPKRELISGMAEVVKYGVIGNSTLFRYIEMHLETISRYDVEADLDVWLHLIEESVAEKAAVVSKDEKESGLRATLNFGHTIAHGIEAYFEYGTYLHGEAVGFGMMAAGYISLKMGMWSETNQDRLVMVLKGLGFDKKVRSISVDKILNIMSLDKKVKEGKLRFVLPTKMGEVVINDAVPEALIIEALMTISENNQ